MAEVFYSDGSNRKYTTSWKETDTKLKNDESIGNQIKSKFYFSKKLPNELLIIKDQLSQSKSIYKFIQNYYSLNEDKTYIFQDVNVKKSFKEKMGGASEINLALITALNTAGIDAKIILISTRDKGFPTKKHPVITDFNYLAAHITIND